MPLIEKFSVQNFGCFRSVSVNFEPFTVLVGFNDSGKSMLLRALRYFTTVHNADKGWETFFPTGQEFIETTFNRGGGCISAQLKSRHDKEVFEYQTNIFGKTTGLTELRDTLNFGGHSIDRQDHHFRVNGPHGNQPEASFPNGFRSLLHASMPRLFKQVGMGAYSDVMLQAQPLSDRFSLVRQYALRAEAIRRVVPIAEYINKPLSLDGEGLPVLLSEILLKDRKQFQRIEDALKKAMPHVDSIGVEQVVEKGGVAARLQMATRGGALVPHHLISDGVLLILGYLTLAYGPYPASVLLIEEPEIGIHHSRLEELVKLFRDLSQGVYGDPVQVIVTTHSPLLLNQVEPKEIRVFSRGEDGAAQVHSFDQAPNLQELLEYQGPGEVWVNQGETYLVGGK